MKLLCISSTCFLMIAKPRINDYSQGRFNYLQNKDDSSKYLLTIHSNALINIRYTNLTNYENEC